MNAEITEAVARAIALSGLDSCIRWPSDFSPAERETYKDQARAAIEALSANTVAPDDSGDEPNELVEFFRGEGYSAYGFEGDERLWPPERTAVHFLREHLGCKRSNTTAAPSGIVVMDDDAELVERLWLATKHGDEEHQAWLREAYTAFFAGNPVPAPRGSGNKEKRIAELEAQLAERLVSKPDGLRDLLSRALPFVADYQPVAPQKLVDEIRAALLPQAKGDAAQCSVGSCQRHGRCMYRNHPRCPLAPSGHQEDL